MTTMLNTLSESLNFSPSDFIDMLLVFLLFYYLLTIVWRTTAFPILMALMGIALITVMATYLNLETFSFVIGKITNILLIVVAILFPAEVRRGLYGLGKILKTEEEADVDMDTIDKVVNVCAVFKKEKIGALIVFKNQDDLMDLVDSGRRLNADISEEILYSIFQKNSPLHDGAIVIDKNKIKTAACYIPTITTEETIDRNMGTRHRAAIGFSQQSDTTILVVSEERGHISVAHRGKMDVNLSPEKLKLTLQERLLGGENA